MALIVRVVTGTPLTGKIGAGIRLPEVQVPIGTYTGWALRATPHDNDGCEGSGQFIPFPKTRAEPLESGDPRSSLEEKYGSVENYTSVLQSAIQDLVHSGFLLPAECRGGAEQECEQRAEEQSSAEEIAFHTA